MRSKYVVSFHILEREISVLQHLMGPFFQVYRHPLNVFSLRARRLFIEYHITVIFFEMKYVKFSRVANFCSNICINKSSKFWSKKKTMLKGMGLMMYENVQKVQFKKFLFSK